MVISHNIIDEFRKIVTCTILTPPDDVNRYSIDENKLYQKAPDIVIFPTSTGEVADIMKLAAKYSIPVTARGGGTSVTGSAVPVKGGIVISLEKMDRILEIDTENLMVVCQPGVINANLQKALKEFSLFYPPDPASFESSTIGGNVAVGAGGMKAVKYGVTRDYVLGLEVVTANGEVISPGGKLKKSATGYDLMHLFIGSEGTLGIITKVILKVLPLPAHSIDLWVPFSDQAVALTMLSRIYRSRLHPAVIEFLEKDCLNAWEAMEGKKHRFSEAMAHLIIQFDGDDPSILEKQCNETAEICLKNGALDVLVADTDQQKERIWNVRRKVSEAMRYVGGRKVSHDIVVPPARIHVFMDKIHSLRRESGFWIVGYGHLGDGNIHVNILQGDMDEKQWQVQLPNIVQAVFKITLDLNGTITGEHGIGLSKKQYLLQAVGPAQLDLMKKIKVIFDPDNILNPDKILPE